jgi:hypothetical protein
MRKPKLSTVAEIQRIHKDPWRWHDANHCRLCQADWRAGKMLKYGVRHHACRSCVDRIILAAEPAAP